MPPKKKQKKDDSWENSEGKKLLLNDLRSGAIPLDPKLMKPAVAFQRRPEAFSVPNYEDGKRLFGGRLRSAREQVRERNERSSVEAAALEQDRKIHPKPAVNHRGEPRWEGSAAEMLLKQDVKEGKHETMQPRELHASRVDYADWPLDVFRNHIYQEVRLQKFIAQRRARHQR